MRKNAVQDVADDIVQNHYQRIWKKIVIALACAVVFCTTYALILPAVTLEKTSYCQKTEHVHDKNCYEQDTNGPETVLVCTPESSDVHEHTEACFRVVEEEADTLICGLEEHTHSAACSVITLIEALPTKQSVEERMAAFKEDGDEAGSNVYLTGLQVQVQEAHEAYDALPEEEQAKVTNIDRLTELEWLRGLSLPETATVTVTNEDNSSTNPTALQKMGIYLGTKLENGHWIAMDGPDEATANVKVDIQLTDSLTALPNCYPFILKVNQGEEFYPDEDAVRRAVGEVNDVQCYKIHWVEVKDDGTYNFNTGMELGNGKNSQIQLEYLKQDAQLKGLKGGRKLRIFSSKSEDGKTLVEISNSVQNVRLMEENYEGFTFNVTEPCPYVFVSEKVEQGYINALSISNVIDGSAPFDQEQKDGNDISDQNRIVRSYDTIQYNLEATFGARQEDITAETVNMYFEMTLRKSATAARFDTGKMLWMGDNYSVEYLNSDGDVIMIMARDGKYYPPRRENGEVVRDQHGFAQADTNQSPISVNARVLGSMNGSNSYKVDSGGVAMQRLVGWTELHANEGESILSATQSFPMAIGVRNADNGEVFAPTFRMWLEGNEENYGPETQSTEGVMLPAQPDPDNIVDISKEENRQYQVTVSAGTNFNLQLKKNTDMSYKNWFDFASGNAVAEPDRTELERLANLAENHGKSNPAQFTENGAALPEDTQARYANYRYGRITCYGITLQLYNDTENENDRNAKGVKGLSLPVGDISFDLNFRSDAKSADPGLDPTEYTPILWDYNENVPANYAYTYNYVDPYIGTVTTPNDGKGNGGRTLYWDGETRSPYAKGGGPSNYIFYHTGCYYGGDWALVGTDGNKISTLEELNTIASPKVVTGTGQGTTYHFKVSDYDFDFDNQHFPTRDAGNSGDIEGYDTYARCFSAGCVQVLSVFPRVQKVSEAEIFLNTTVSNLHLTTRAGQELKAQENDATRIQHEVNTKDNTRRDQIVLYAPGGLTKGSSFNGRYKDKDPQTTTEGFLGTDYWTTSYDCSTFAGDDIWIVSYGMISAGSDYRMHSMNLLQLFDSRALTVRDKPDVCQNFDVQYDKEGTATFLYAADPDYPDGYDTNQDGVMAYMNSVREEDLVYSDTMPDANGYIEVNGKSMKCVGVLMELRGCDLLGGKYQYMRIPVKVNGDDQELVGKTVATVNTFRVWSYDLKNISWANGDWNDQKQENTLTDFPKPENNYDHEGYSGEMANRSTGSPPYYVKTEYQDNLQVKGTHAGGTLAGNSLLILSYKAGVNIGVDNKQSTGMISYNLGDGESVVDYRLTNIRTEISDHTGQTQSPTTTLTINTVLDEGYTGENQRISVSGGSYRIKGYAVDAGGNAASEETNISISGDQYHPTELEFTGSDGRRHRVRIYAQLGSNSQSVRFVIQDAPVGIHLPDITFQANFAAVTALKNNDTLRAAAYISGEGDNRAYAQAKGNTDNVTVGVILRSGTNLTKKVNTRYIELNGTITYDVTYTNSGTDVIPKIYFYDLLPNTEDIRDSEFSGNVVLRHFDVTSSKAENASPANATVYYSTTEYQTLYDTVKVFGGSMDANGTVSGMDAQKVENMLENSDLFKPLGRVESGSFQYDEAFGDMSAADKTALMSDITGLYAKVENLQKGKTITLQFTLETENNEANDWYKNIANSWIAGASTLPLTSNKVETQVVSRKISGVIWHDKNLNGIRDDDEPRLSDVTATLFKVDETGQYVRCDKDVIGSAISPVTTGSDGEYSFDKLAEGNYVVAFSGEELKKFTDATTYQSNGQNDVNTNDGKAVTKERTTGTFDVDGYDYYIQYSANSQNIPLHSIDEMRTVTLDNGVEMYANQDLGLIVSTYELPKTGGAGTTSYTMGGLLLIASAGVLRLYSNRKRRREDRASSDVS